MPFFLVHGDLTCMQVDAVVNAANNALQMGGGVCGAIFAAAGQRDLQQACDRIGCCETGKAVSTPGYRLPARQIIHTVGPVWRGGGQREEEQLRSCYRSVLELAQREGLSSVAFPLISSGIYGYPREQAMQVAVSAIEAFLKQYEMTVYLVLFGHSDNQPNEPM